MSGKFSNIVSDCFAKESPVVIFCDLDDTLFRTDLLWESLIFTVKRNPLSLVKIPLWLLRGRSFLKEGLAARCSLDVSALPYNEGVLSYLQLEKSQGRRIYLATASHVKLAAEVARYLGFFDGVIATSMGKNLKGQRKLEEIRRLIKDQPFEYIGDSPADLPIWKEAQRATVVGSRVNPAKVGLKGPAVEHIPSDIPRSALAVLRLMRPHQWVKNLLVFIPLFAAHAVADPKAVISSLVAFMAFSLTASSGYIINDLCDLNADRHHLKKRNRPIASGAVAIPVALVFLVALGGIGFGSSLLLPVGFSAVLAVYFALTLSYSLLLKSYAILDVVFLAMLYVIRVIGGHEATGLMYSPWLLIFSMFFFSSLAFVKRYSELRAMDAASTEKIRGRGYVVSDTGPVLSMGSASGYLSLLVLAQYIYSDQVTKLYSQPHALLLLLPLSLFWISRIWLLAGRGEMHHDPVVFAMTDRVSLVIGGLSVLIVLVASLI